MIMTSAVQEVNELYHIMCMHVPHIAPTSHNKYALSSKFDNNGIGVCYSVCVMILHHTLCPSMVTGWIFGLYISYMHVYLVHYTASM